MAESRFQGRTPLPRNCLGGQAAENRAAVATGPTVTQRTPRSVVAGLWDSHHSDGRPEKATADYGREETGRLGGFSRRERAPERLSGETPPAASSLPWKPPHFSRVAAPRGPRARGLRESWPRAVPVPGSAPLRVTSTHSAQACPRRGARGHVTAAPHVTRAGVTSSRRAAAGAAPEPPGRGGGAWAPPGQPASPAPAPRAGAQVSGPGAAAGALPRRLTRRRPLRAGGGLQASSAATSVWRLSGRGVPLLLSPPGRRPLQLGARGGPGSGALGRSVAGDPGRGTAARWGRVCVTGRAGSDPPPQGPHRTAAFVRAFLSLQS